MKDYKSVEEQLRNWQLQQKQEGQQELRNKYEYMNEKYRQMKNDYSNFRNVRKNDDDDAVFNKSSELADKNSYMRYELNNTFQDKDDKKGFK
jgi:DNA anti-recombination protein RmuC